MLYGTLDFFRSVAIDVWAVATTKPRPASLFLEVVSD